MALEPSNSSTLEQLALTGLMYYIYVVAELGCLCQMAADDTLNTSALSVLLSVTALHCASSRGHVTCVDVLLTSSANVNSVDCSGCTPLFYAITSGHAHSVTSLLQHGADPNHVDLKGRTYVLHLHVYTVFVY